MNLGHYTICPYYVRHYKSVITCEGTRKRFASPSALSEWMRLVCDAGEQSECGYASMLSRLYALDSEEGEKRMTEAKVRSTLAENRKLNRSIDELEERIEQLQKSLEEQGKRYAAKCDEIAALNRREMDAFRELNELAHLCEARVVYLLCKLAGDPAGKVEFDEGEFKAWAATHEWKMTPEVNEDGGSIVLRAFEYEVREIENETGGPAGENPETSGRETDGAAESKTED